MLIPFASPAVLTGGTSWPGTTWRRWRPSRRGRGGWRSLWPASVTCHVSRMSRGPGLLRCGEGTDGKTTLYSACSRSPPLLWPIILSNNLNNAPSCSDNLLTSLKQYYDVVSNMEELFSSLKYYCIFLRLKTVLWFETYETCSTATEWRIHDKIYIWIF